MFMGEMEYHCVLPHHLLTDEAGLLRYRRSPHHPSPTARSPSVPGEASSSPTHHADADTRANHCHAMSQSLLGITAITHYLIQTYI